MAVFAVVKNIVRVPFVFAPFQSGRKLLLGVFNRPFFGAELLAEFNSTGRTDFNTFAACNTVFRFNMGTVSGR